MTIFITIANNKGGTAKTTTATSLAHAIAEMGGTVLLVDLDPQGQSATALGLAPQPGVFHLLTMELNRQSSAYLASFLQDTQRLRFTLLVGNKQTILAQTLINHPEDPKPISWVRDTLAYHFSEPTHVLLDTAPSVGGLQERALWAADWVILPTPAEALGTDGLRQVLETLKRLKDEKGWPGQLLGVLPTFFVDRQREHRLTYAAWEQKLKGRLLPPIHRAAVLAECQSYGQTIFERYPTSKAAFEYAELARLILKAR